MRYEFGNLIVECIVTGTWKENCYVLTNRDSGESAVVDPGSDAAKIRTQLDQNAADVRHIVCTHGHFDHMGAAAELCELTGRPFSIHKADLPLLRRAPLYAMTFEKSRIRVPQGICQFEAATSDQPVTLRLGSTEIEVWPVPGHTPGSVCFYADGCLFSGDTLLNEQMGRTDLPGGDRNLLVESISSLLRRLEGDVVILPGHGDSWTLKEARSWWISSEVNTGVNG